jgi:hypothetical protein
MDQKLWRNENLRRNLGRVDMCWNHLCKKMWAEEEGKFCKGGVQGTHLGEVGNC